MRFLVLVAVLLLSPTSALATKALASPDEDGLMNWWSKINRVLDEIAASHKIAPPKAVRVRWHPRRIWNGKTSGEFLDLIAADLNGDGKSALIALTSREILILSAQRGLFDIRDRQDLPQRAASLRSRDAIGALSVGIESEKVVIRARSSEQAVGGLYTLVDGVMALQSTFDGYPLCHEASIEAAPAQNFFEGASATWPAGREAVTLGKAIYSARCSRGAVNPSGYPVQYVSEVSTSGTLRIHCTGEATHCDSVTREYQNAGYGHLVADVDGDGHPEILATTDAPVPPDKVVVYSQGAREDRILFEKSLDGGVVAIAAGDLDGDGAQEIVAAVRTKGLVDLWLLN